MQISVYIINSIQLVITFLANALALSTFFGMIDFICPIRSRILSDVMTVLRIPFTGQNVVIFLSAVCVLVPVILHRTRLMRRYVLWSMDCRKPDIKEKERFEKAMDIVCEKNRDDINYYELYVSDMDDDNAWSLGDNIVIVSKRLLESAGISTYTIAGLMAHEVGHIKNHHNHTYLITNVVAMLGNTVIRIYHILGEIFLELTGIPFLGRILIFPG